ncbi:putative sodium-dependent excitatory amino acid transporter glt-4 [Octopus vulgaris]|uniref:Amino acid transporter n=1 Tax=Octopus vulgaris TaxID=6645 RepID=A0AA36B4L6_OCTVU|nr:putative sodium-dependent excitatory amino acid transporter glt-4 [Octopus vulgaris]
MTDMFKINIVADTNLCLTRKLSWSLDNEIKPRFEESPRNSNVALSSLDRLHREDNSKDRYSLAASFGINTAVFGDQLHTRSIQLEKMKQLDSSPSSRVSPVETECTERVNTPETVDKDLPSETASKTLHEEKMDKVENSLIDIQPPRDELQEENNESALDGEKTLQMLSACSADEENQTMQSFESDNTIKQEVQTDIHNLEFNQTGKKMDESSSVCGETNIFAVSDSVSSVDEVDNLIQVSDCRTSFNEEETSSLKDSDVPSTDLSKTDSTVNFGDMNPASDNEEDSLSECTATYNRAEQENRPSSSEGESSSLKDGDIPLTDLSKTDLTDISEDMNPVFNNQDASLFDGATTYNNTEQETAFTSVGYEPSVKCCIRDSISENNVKSSPVCQNESSTQNNSNCNKFSSNTIEESTSSPVHFRKKIRKMEILRIPTKTSQKRKKKTLEIAQKDAPIFDVDTTIYVEEDNSSPVIANGLHLNENSRECSDESLSTRHQRNSMNNTKKSNCFSSASNTVTTVQKFFVTVDSSSSDSELSTTSDDDNQCRQKCKKCKTHSLNLLAFLASVFALVTGTCLRSVISSRDYRTILYLRLPGQLFTNVLQMLAIPLIISGLISNLASLDRGLARRICLRTFFYYSITSFIALMTGVILALTIQPGQFGVNLTVEKQAVPKVNILDVMSDLLRTWIFLSKVRGTTKTADTSSYNLEEKLIASAWAHDRVHSGKIMEDVRHDFTARFGRLAPPKKTILRRELKLFLTGSIKDKPRTGQPST